MKFSPRGQSFRAQWLWSGDEGDLRPVAYNPAIPIEPFDFIVTNECHRSIYGLWRQVLKYFDAHLIGLTATPSSHTLVFFKLNLVAQYPYEQSVADGVNVGFEAFCIRTLISEHGETVNAEYDVRVLDRQNRAIRYKQLDGDLPYTCKDLDQALTVPPSDPGGAGVLPGPALHRSVSGPYGRVGSEDPDLRERRQS